LPDYGCVFRLHRFNRKYVNEKLSTFCPIKHGRIFFAFDVLTNLHKHVV
jgi:hypothetical protein